MQSQTPDIVDGDTDSNAEGDTPDEGKGKASSSSSRKVQNRIAQREFRQRKQQYVRDLEARLEVLSADKEDRVEMISLIIRNLLKENKELREMVKKMASFLGEGLGSCLPRLGLTSAQMDAIVNRPDTETAHEAFTSLKASKEMERDNPGLLLRSPRRRASSAKRKRSSANPISVDSTGNGHEGGSVTKEQPTGEEVHGNDQHDPSSMDPYAYLFPDLSSAVTTDDPAGTGGQSTSIPTPNLPWSTIYQPQTFHPQPQNPVAQQAFFPSQPNILPPGSQTEIPHTMDQGQTMLNDNMFALPFVQTGFGLTLPGPLSVPTYGQPSLPVNQSTSQGSTSTTPTQNATVDLVPPPVEIEKQRRLRNAVAELTSHEKYVSLAGSMTHEQVKRSTRRISELQRYMESEEVPHGEMKLEAMQMITYHLNNFRVNQGYSLPSSLRPTKVQRTIPHELAIDGIIFPSIRDRMILLRGQYDLIDAFQSALSDFRVHGTDILDHHNWEVSEKWIKDYRILVDEEVYYITNKWRLSRGEGPLNKPETAESTQDAWSLQAQRGMAPQR